MSSQGSLSSEVLTLISEVTDQALVGSPVEKYTHMYLFDVGELRRVSDVIWSTARPAS